MKTLIHQSEWMTINEVNRLSVLNKAQKTVEIDIEGVIGGSFLNSEDNEKAIQTKEKMKSELKAISQIKAEKIIVNINSPGGSVAHGISIHDLLASHPAEVVTRVNGMTASIATVILQAGNKREMSDNSLILTHLASYSVFFASLNSNDLEEMKDDLETTNKRIINIYTKRSGKNEKVFRDLMNAQNGKGRWIDSKEAIEYGLIDETFEPMQAAALLSNETLNKYKLPLIMDKQLEIFNTETQKVEVVEEEIENNEPVIQDAEKKGFLQEMKDFVKNLVVSREKEKPVEKEPVDLKEYEEQFDILKAIIEDMKKEKQELQAKYDDLEGNYIRLTAKSTKIGSAKGNEDRDEKKLDPLAEMLNNDLMTLRNELTITRHDN